MSERSRLETTLDVLRAVGEGAEEVNYIMLKARLSRAAAHSFLVQLVRQGLILQPEDGRYFITARGREVLAEMVYLLTDFPYVSQASTGETLFAVPS